MTPPKHKPPRRVPWFKTVRIGVLLLILLTVALTAWQDGYRSRRWRSPLFVAVYPIAADESPVTRRYMEALDAGDFEPIDGFFAREALRHGLKVSEPFRPRLQPPLKVLPPQRRPQDGVLATIFWSLKLRYWAWDVTHRAREPADVRIFVLYHDPALSPTVPHSLGLTKGLIGVVYAFADPSMTGSNNVVIAHEMLHTVGATDKYDRASDAPRFPEGYGNPAQSPLYPQQTAEIMAGKRMLAADRWEQARSLDEAVIGDATALEIRWPTHAE